MPIRTSECVQSLEENSKDVYLETTSVLLKLMDNILSNPRNQKFRRLRLENPTISSKLLPAIGAMECLFEMGFQEGDGTLILPDHSSLEHLKQMRDQISVRRNMYLKSPFKEKAPVDPVVNNQPSTSRVAAPPEPDLQIRTTPTSFLQSLWIQSQAVLQYENKKLQEKARKLIPLSEFELKAEMKMHNIRKTIKQGGSKEQEIDIRDLLLIELLSWFKNSFFTWVDSPQCCYCLGGTKFAGLSSNPQDLKETSRVEVYVCTTCSNKTLFPRYNDVGRLLETRKGRCGEWANCFTLLCRALGWDARHVMDQTDHVWTEVYSLTQSRWLHCDPCENTYDTPLMYECGWGKKLTYVIAFSYDDIQDVTWRYTCQYPEVLSRRSLCSEEALQQEILRLRRERQSKLSPARRNFLIRRLLRELVEFLSPQQPEQQQDYKGRSSGSLAWRLARGETDVCESEIVPFVWEPTSAEREVCELNISYSATQDKYMRGKEEVQHWEKGVFSAESIHRKEERDWKIAYLARAEGSDKGSVKWKIDCSKSGLIIDSVSIKCVGTVFETGTILMLLCNEDTCLRLPAGESIFETTELSGSTSFTLSAELSGGNGSVAWQHAQLFRQEMSNTTDYPLNIIVKLRRP